MLEHKVMLQLHQVCLFSHQVNLRGFLENEGQEQAGIEGISPQALDQSQGSSVPRLSSKGSSRMWVRLQGCVSEHSGGTAGSHFNGFEQSGEI